MSILSDELIKELKETAVLSPRYRTAKVQLVLIAGKKHHGKTTVSDYLFHQLVNKFPTLPTQQESLASPIKINAMEFYGWDGQKDEKGRKLLQEIGDTGRNYDEDIFCKYLDNRCLSGLFIPNVVIIDDWRYPNEKEYFAKSFMYDITTIRVERNLLDDSATASHKSENSLPLTNWQWYKDFNSDEFYNFSIFNAGSIEDLYSKLDGIINHLSKKVITY
jgi:hypothetical protein